MTRKTPSSLSFTGIFEVIAVLLCLASATGFLARLFWIFELAVHFRLHLAISLVLLGMFWGFKRRRRLALVCFAFALVNAALVFPLFWPGVKFTAHSGACLRLISLNVHTENKRAGLVLDFLRGSSADIILLMEVNGRWMQELSSLHGIYPHQVSAPREDNFGIALFSRLPMTNTAIIEVGGAEIPTIAADVCWEGRTVFILGTHPLPPGSSENAGLRNAQLEGVAGIISKQRKPAIVIGDLNATPWSPFFRDLLKVGGLKNTSQGLGIYNSWPAWFSWAGIPIDHCLVSSSWGVVNKQVGPQVESDHLPVMIDLQLTPAKTEAF